MSEIQSATACPVCGTALSQEQTSEGLCLGCLMELALESPSLMAEVENSEDAPTVHFADETTFSEGRVHGERYRIRSLLGRGGMGEVWRAYDLKLRLDVALKSLRAELLADEHALETLRQEVRTAREVVSPNVCRVFDLQELDDQELISMEYVDGTTLQEILKNRGPLGLNEAREIASQFLAGLEAIHAAGLVHRDIKPENLMITRTGRVVVMDFGIAKALQEGKAGTIAGTPAYMSPEQTRGQDLDPRADLFSAGVVLAEMVEPAGTRSLKNRKRIWEGIHQESPQVTETPWTKVIARAVAPDREERFASATTLARALEDVTLRAAGDEDARPYPGLSAFQEEDAEYFFGRELEVEALWKKLQRPQMLAVIGPSGAGKSSFLRAGVLSSLPESWSVVLATPGDRPFAALARSLAKVLPGDQGTTDALLRFEEPATAMALIADWRAQHEHGLILLDQFEELFTQNPMHVQSAVAELLGRLPLEADVHVLLSMRDDFLFHCQGFEPLNPIFSELTPIGAPTGAALRRAIVQPALKCGYRFEDESLVEEMLGEVEGQRGSLPMVAFAAAKLWQTRDRDLGLLTREAYEQIGGVGGALAQHAEATLERIGTDQIPIVRELFRNLVTAEGTRATRDQEDLLSVFGVSRTAKAGAEAGHYNSDGSSKRGPGHSMDGDGVGAGLRAGPSDGRRAAEDVLNALIDARLLTSYEVSGTDGEERRTRIEIIHESLLGNWPRLVRWQTQDADSAQLRDQLRQAAQVWKDRGRPTDLLWAGTSYQEFGLWRQRYQGGLTSAEEEFARAMTAHAERRRRRRRAVLVGAIAILIAVLAVVFASRQEARQQALRAEASQLLALGRLEIEGNTTGALAYALASLEHVDDLVTRRFVLEALSQGPTAMVLEGFPGEDRMGGSLDFSPDGQWLATGGYMSLQLWSRTGGKPRVLDDQEALRMFVRYGLNGEFVVSADYNQDEIQIWSVPDGQLKSTLATAGQVDFRVAQEPDRIITLSEHQSLTRAEAWLPDGGERIRHIDLDTQIFEWSAAPFAWNLDIDATGSRMVYTELHTEERKDLVEKILLVDLDDDNESPPRLLGIHNDAVARTAFHPDGSHVASADTLGEVRIWSLESESESLQRVLHQPPAQWVRNLRFNSSGKRLAAATWSGHAAVWDLEGPPDADPMLLRRGETGWMLDATFHPGGDWVATSSHLGVALWPITRHYPLVLRGHEGALRDLIFLPDSSGLVSSAGDGTVRFWPLSASSSQRHRVLFEEEYAWLTGLAVDPQGRQLLVSDASGQVWVISLNGDAARKLTGLRSASKLAVGRDQAFAIGRHDGSRFLRAWNLETGEIQDLETDTEILLLRYTPDDQLISFGPAGLRIWNLDDGSFEVLAEPEIDYTVDFTVDLNRDGHLLLVGDQGDKGEAVLFDIEMGTSLQLDSHGPKRCGAPDPTGKFVVTLACDRSGELRIGPVTGGPVHLLVGAHSVSLFVISPDGKWIASKGGDDDHTIRLWPVPDLTQPPLHTLPHDELLAKLRSLTNLRVIPDPESDTGWGWDLEPFPGWEQIPTW